MMDAHYLYTSRLILAPLTLDMLKALQKGAEAFRNTTSWTLPDNYTDFPESIEYNIGMITDSALVYPWVSYAIILRQQSTYIGQCGFKSTPTADFSTEIGYEIAEGFRSNGYADEAIKELLKTAFADEGIDQVIAHTLALKNASNHLLIKNGFTFEACIQDEEDGLIWKWRLPKMAYFLKKMT